MARVCQVTGKRPMSGHNVSHANNKTKTPLSAKPSINAASGWKAKIAGYVCALPTLRYVPLIKTVLIQ